MSSDRVMSWDGEFASRPTYQPLVSVVVAVAAGIAVDRYGIELASGLSQLGFIAWWCLAATCLVGWWIVRRRPTVAISLLITAIMFSGAAWHHLRWHVYSAVDLGRYATHDTQPACVTGTILSAPEILPAPRRTALRAIPEIERTGAVIELDAIRDGTEWLPAGGRSQLMVDGHLLGMQAGDRVQVFAQLRRPGEPMNPGQFDFAAHARADRRLATLRTESPDCVTRLDDSAGRPASRAAGAIRASGQQIIRRFISPERADVAAAMLLGVREGLSTDEIEPFFLTGTIHLLVVSGLHVGILAMGLYAALRLGWLPRRTALALIMGVVVVFALVTGGEPPVVRAGVLVILVCMATWTGERAIAFNSLAAAALVVLAINPAELFQVGTQLSFLAVATLMWVHQAVRLFNRRDFDPLDRLIAASRPWWQQTAAAVGRWNVRLLVTVAAVWLAALPLVLYRFHLVSPIAVALSPVIWILVLVALWAGFLTLLAGWLVLPLAAPFGFACDLALGWLQDVVRWAEALPVGHFWAPGPALWWVLGFYAGLAVVMIGGRVVVRPRWQIAILCCWVIVGLAPPLARATTRSDVLQCSFIALGHGECVVLEMPGGETILYDAGALSSPEYATRTIASFLWERGILRIDAIILSHADVDHYNAVPGLLERFRVAAVYVSPHMFDRFGATGPADGPTELRRAIEAAEVPIHEIWAGDRLPIGSGGVIDVLHPPRDGIFANDNASSITLAVESAGRRILLPGDLESPGLEDLVAELPYDCDVLLAPHHGSRRSDPPGLAAWCTPELVVISGRADADPVVRQTYEQAGARVLNTGEDGAVEITLMNGRTHAAAFARPD